MNKESGGIGSLFFVLLSAVGLAAAIAAYMVYSSNPGGQYLAANVLLSPEVAKVMSYEERSGGKTVHYQFEGIEYLYYDSEQGRWDKVAVSANQYQDFFSVIKADRSEAELSNQVFQLFNTGVPSMLVLKVRPDSSETGKTFQEVQFIDGSDYYRLTLREGQGTGEWAYFYHKGIADIAIELFAHRTPKKEP